MDNKKEIICFVAGHSGGHILPSITQAKKELEKNNNLDILFICTNNSLDKKILDQSNLTNNKILLTINNFSKRPFNFLKCIFYLKLAFLKSIIILIKNKPKKIVSMGGLISIPVCLAGKILKIPIELWELNLEPGKAIQFLSNFVNKINICYDETQDFFPKKQCILSNYPIRFNIQNKNLESNQIIEKIKFFNNLKTIFVVGGSQGSLYINDLIKDFIIDNLDLTNQIQIIHQTGKSNINFENFYKEKQIKAFTFEFYKNIEEFYLISDIIICRSGAGTLAEILFFEKQCITIPLETNYTSHQIFNAKSLAKKYPHLINVVLQNQNKKIIFNQIKNLLNI